MTKPYEQTQLPDDPPLTCRCRRCGIVLKGADRQEDQLYCGICAARQISNPDIKVEAER